MTRRCSSAPSSPKKALLKVLEQARCGVFELCLSKAIIEELRSRLLYRRKIHKSYQYTDERVEQYCRDLEAVARVVSALPRVRVIERDPNDDMIIACALAARADYIRDPRQGPARARRARGDRHRDAAAAARSAVAAHAGFSLCFMPLQAARRSCLSI